MHILKRKTLVEYWTKYPDSEGPLKAWFHEVKKAEWNSWTDAKALYPSLSPVGGDRYVFNIKGNNYRLVVKIQFKPKLVFVRFFGTHSEYDKIENIEEV